ncbi:MAG: lamin tail domain-containing protein, partial [Planctomycetes bacterium]|nr:lamin tail domain-containing protein [Planctomycetota bacterium]
KSTGASDFTALTEPTPGKPNAAPVVGPIVITEILYHPADVQDAEYVELLNISDQSVSLYDAEKGVSWRFTDDPDDPTIDMLFPSDSVVNLLPGEYLILAQDPAAIRTRYGLPTRAKIYGWGAGRLADGSGKVQLSRPFAVEDDGAVEWLAVDRVSYSDGSHPQDFVGGVDPWPVEADGQDLSLHRIDPQAYGNDPANWQAATPSPGKQHDNETWNIGDRSGER